MDASICALARLLAFHDLNHVYAFVRVPPATLEYCFLHFHILGPCVHLAHSHPLGIRGRVPTAALPLPVLSLSEVLCPLEVRRPLFFHATKNTI